MSFITEDFMLNSETAKRLYQNYAKDLPIFDYHCHLSPEWIATDYQFNNITEIWLYGDHYKWRAMRANGVPESCVTGDASDEEKFKAWAETLDKLLGNPLYHWTHLELKRYFGIDELLTADNWADMYHQLNQQIRDKQLSARQLIKQSNVVHIGTTDDPIDSLNYHKEIAADASFPTVVSPSFRPDKVMQIDQPDYQPYLKKLEDCTSQSIETYADLLVALKKRVAYFDQHGAVTSDHALTELVYREADQAEIEAIFKKGMLGERLSIVEQEKYVTRLLVDLAKLYHEHGWVMQLHYGALRNNNSRWLDQLGPDTGFDAIHDSSHDAQALNLLLNEINQHQQLPKTIVYCLNGNQFELIAATLANFQANEQGIKSKLQLGSGWWFNDTEANMLRQMQAVANQGLLAQFVGMLTDSRSFLSYPRHEYFRRILCNMIGEQVESGRIPKHERLLEELIAGISYQNAVTYFKANK
ncbi:D-glucuronate isomerase [Amphibacillus marinus]|uniref:Uronate isomerase n=1 Tax=Amphibacillus marinus TaxID=872970 RepID=A0A1H8TB37_9BACI|nr:glucuronate isomerase [Amphibacillus marinus]SEO88310.1 D-glucuronate isomerase [Amphibacillus marinus]